MQHYSRTLLLSTIKDYYEYFLVFIHCLILIGSLTNSYAGTIVQNINLPEQLIYGPITGIDVNPYPDTLIETPFTLFDDSTGLTLTQVEWSYQFDFEITGGSSRRRKAPCFSFWECGR